MGPRLSVSLFVCSFFVGSTYETHHESHDVEAAATPAVALRSGHGGVEPAVVSWYRRDPGTAAVAAAPALVSEGNWGFEGGHREAKINLARVQTVCSQEGGG